MDGDGALLPRRQGPEGDFELGILAVVENSHRRLLMVVMDSLYPN